MTYEDLIKFIQHHNYRYYDLNRIEISDEEYDKYYDALIKVENAQGWSAHNSPTRKVGGSPGKIRHAFTLYSLKKVYEIEEIDLDTMDVKTSKIDGSNITITYKNGSILNTLTRGDGEFGENVIHLVEHIKGVPETISEESLVVITGECVTDNKNIDNFRNYVAGALNLKNPEEFKTRNIRFLAHDWLGMKMDYTSRMNIVANMGFNTVLDKNLIDKYPTDGIVYRINNQKECERLGYTSKHPRFAVALKERGSLTATSVLQDVIWVVGRTGTVNPTGIIDPVVIDGATITRVTLHNIGIIKEHKLGLGDTIEIERAGGIIPKFNQVLVHSPHNSKIEQRHAELAIGMPCKRVGPKLYIDGPSQGVNVKLLEYFIKTLSIKGLGPKSITKLELSHPADLYTPQRWELLGANGIKIKEEIEKSKTKPYEVVLAALGIPGVGRSTARCIVQHIPRFQHLRDVELKQIKGVGPKTIENILAWLEENEKWVLQLPLKLEQIKSIDVDVLSDQSDNLKKICITGKLDMTKEEMREHLLPLGYEVLDTVTKNTYALICAGDKQTSKHQKALKYGIKILDYWPERNNILKGTF